MSQSQAVIARINEIRSMSFTRALTMDEMKEAVRLIRQDRKGAATVSAASKAKKAKSAVQIDVQSILDNF